MSIPWGMAFFATVVGTGFAYQEASSGALEQARTAVINALRVKNFGNLESITVEMHGAPVMLPNHQTLHRGRAAATVEVPEAFIPTIVRASNVFQQPAVVALGGGQAAARLSYNRQPGSGDFLPMQEEEWRGVAKALEPFYAAAIDVRRGPERFHRFLPADIREMLRHEQRKMRLFLPRAAVDELSENELRRFVALSLDSHVTLTWAVFEGVQDRVRQLPQNVLGLLDAKPGPRAFMGSMERFLSDARDGLRDIGALDRKHIELCAPYVRHLLGQGIVAREDPNRDPVRLPAGVPMYSALLGPSPAGVYVHFVIENGALRIVAMDLL